MIVTPRFAFIPLHKSGGTFVNEALLRFLPGARQIGYHLPCSRLPRECRGLRVVGLVRSPWSFYVSWYSYQASLPAPNALFRIASDQGRAGFASTIARLLGLGRDDALLDRVLGALPSHYGNRGLNLPAQALEPLRGQDLGFYSFLHEHLYGGAEGLDAVKLESIRQDLPRALEATGTSVPPALRDFLECAAPRNASIHAPEADLYDANLRDAVARADAGLIERHAYRFSADSVVA